MASTLLIFNDAERRAMAAAAEQAPDLRPLTPVLRRQGYVALAPAIVQRILESPGTAGVDLGPILHHPAVQGLHLA